MSGPEALQAMRDGKWIRHGRWTKDCWISARPDNDIGVYLIWPKGTPIFVRDVEEDKEWILWALLEDGWETEE
jgi:hypothetical protein